MSEADASSWTELISTSGMFGNTGETLTTSNSGSSGSSSSGSSDTSEEDSGWTYDESYGMFTDGNGNYSWSDPTTESESVAAEDTGSTTEDAEETGYEMSTLIGQDALAETTSDAAAVDTDVDYSDFELSGDQQAYLDTLMDEVSGNMTSRGLDFTTGGSTASADYLADSLNDMYSDWATNEQSNVSNALTQQSNEITENANDAASLTELAYAAMPEYVAASASDSESGSWGK